MKSSIGNTVNLTIFGESHSAAIGGVINGLSAGIKLDIENIESALYKRSARGKISTSRKEPDKVKFLSGYYNGYTTGTPLCYIIENTNVKSGDYADLKAKPRPSHADYTADVKYGGFQDYRGGGHFSGRLTAPIVVAGAICEQLLHKQGVAIATHILSLHNEIFDIPFGETEKEMLANAELLRKKDFPAISAKVEQKMTELIEKTTLEGDSVGGVLETVILGADAGIGEPMFYSVESVLSHLFYSIPAVKGVSFGAGFDIGSFFGSEANDRFIMAQGAVKTETNHNGGINGGITNGMPITAKIAVKPTPSIFKPQQTVDLATGENTTLAIKGRHDPAIIHRAAVVATAMAAIGMVDLYSERYGISWQKSEEK